MQAVHQRFAAFVAWSDLKQAGVGKLLGISQVSVSKLARGETKRPRFAVAKRLERLSANWPDGPIIASEWGPWDFESEVEDVEPITPESDEDDAECEPPVKRANGTGEGARRA